jgi:hypothetical protein
MINVAKWKMRAIGQLPRARVPGEGVTSDLKIENSSLSFWACDPTQSSSLEQVVLALASGRDKLDRLDLVWLDEAAIAKAKARLVESPGDTPAQEIRDRHRDLTDFSLNGVFNLARGIAKAANGGRTKRWTKAEVLKILTDAANTNALDFSQLSEEIRDKIQSAQAQGPA